MNVSRKVGALVSCLVVSGLLAACGSSTSSSSSSARAVAGAGTSRFAADRAKLVACLKQHGVTLPSRPGGGFRHRFTPGGGQSDTGSGGSGSGGSGQSGSGGPPHGGFGGGGFFGGRAGSDPKLQTAFKACASDFPHGRSTFRGAAHQTAVTKFVTCVRRHGYDLPKPNFSGKGPVFPSNIQANPKFQAASKPCAKLLVAHGGPPQGAPPPQGSGQPSA
jgi:hypothetical protein